MNPLERWTPQQAAQHPFITQKLFLEPFVPMRHAKPFNQTTTNDTRSSAMMQPQKQEIVADPYGQGHGEPALRRQHHSNEALAYPPLSAGGGQAMNQVVGTFSEFQINPASAPGNAFYNSPFHASSAYKSQSYAAPSTGAFPIRKAKSQFSVPMPASMQHYNSSPGLHQNYNGEQEYYEDGHPRYGDHGERVRIPSRIPSVAGSVEWELFEGGASVPNSYAGSRQGSSADMNQFVEGRRPSQSYASPNSFRQMPFQAHRKVGSFSNDSFVNDTHNFPQRGSNYGKSSESLKAAAQESFASQNLQSANPNLSPHGSPRNYVKAHKKVKSTSSFGTPIIDHSLFSRRPSVPNNFYPLGMMPPVPPPTADLSFQQLRPLQGFQQQAQQQLQQRPVDQYPGQHSGAGEEMQFSPGGTPFSSSRPIDLPNLRNPQQRE